MMPKVSVLLCHRNMRHLVQTAIDCYLNQDWTGGKELIVVDDGEQFIGGTVRDVPNCLYLNFEAQNLSQKRNLGAREASGEYIVHFDADDWSGPHRVTDQVELMLANPTKNLGGYGQALWYDFVHGKASYYHGTAWGATLIYKREYALAHPWDEGCSFAEDSLFMRHARDHETIVCSDGKDNFVATMHSQNAHRWHAGTSQGWPFIEIDDLPEGFRRAANLQVEMAVK
jgi:hypothetical protein